MARGSIDLGIVSKFDNKGISKAQRAFQKFGGVAAGVATATVGAIAGIGAAATRMASEFETSFAQIEGLVGVSKDQLGELEDAARTLGPQFGKSANEAAEALFFITSAGLRGESAINVLEASLKGAAIGLGDTKTIADLATSAVNAYGESNLNGAQAVDLLAEAVRLGKLEPAELAGAMGQVLPLASNLGVSFDQVGAALAGMSKTGTDASTAATQLRQILATLSSPTVGAERALAELGLSAEGLREQIREEGLYSTLETLTDAFDGNIEATTEVFGNIRALSGVLDLMGASAEDNKEIFAQMSDEVGVLDEALAITEETGAFKFARAMETLQASLLPVGDLLLEIGGQLLDELMPLIEGVGPGLLSMFEGMRPALEEFAALLPGLLEALAPVAAVFGELGRIFMEVLVASMPIITSLLELLTPILELLIPVLDIIVGLFELLVLPIELLLGFLTPLLETILPPLTEAFGFLSDAITVLDEVFSPIVDVLLPVFADFVEKTVGPVMDHFTDQFKTLADDGMQYLIDQGIIPAGVSLETLADDAKKQSYRYANFIIDALNGVIAVINYTIASFVELNNKILEGLQAFGLFKDVPKLSFEPIAPFERVQPFDYLEFDEVDVSGVGESGFIRDLERQFEQAASSIGPVQARSEEGNTWTFKGLQPRAMGGRVMPNMGYLVGEQGPEIFVPNDMGEIIPNSRLGGGGPTYNITIQTGVGDPVRIGEEIVTAVKRYERVSGPVFVSA